MMRSLWIIITTVALANLIAIVAFVTPLGGVFLVVGHLRNRSLSRGTACSAACCTDHGSAPAKISSTKVQTPG